MTLLILTIGTGTSGKHSDLAAGMRRTVELIQPTNFWLLPSAAADSLAVADLVREGFDTFVPWSPNEPYRCILRPDSLQDARQTVREVIRKARLHLTKNDRLIVNPTSGTKQMSAGATLAALDEGIGEIVFTIGDRADGVVKTGTERLEVFDAASHYAERDLHLAHELFRAGSYHAAHQLLARHPSLTPHAQLALCSHEWQRQNYEPARRLAANCPLINSTVRSHLQALAQAAQHDAPSPLIIADLLQTAQLDLDHGDNETALFRSCKALESGLRLALYNNTRLRDPFPLGPLCALPIPDDLRHRLTKNSRDQRTVRLGLAQIVEILSSLGDPIGENYEKHPRLQALVTLRNNLAHSICSVKHHEAQDLITATTQLLLPLQLPPPPPRPLLTP